MPSVEDELKKREAPEKQTALERKQKKVQGPKETFDHDAFVKALRAVDAGVEDAVEQGSCFLLFFAQSHAEALICSHEPSARKRRVERCIGKRIHVAREACCHVVLFCGLRVKRD